MITRPPDGAPLHEQPAWRQDFPIDWPQDHYVERRDFTKFMVLTSLAFAVGQFWIVVQNWLRRRRGQPPTPQDRVASTTCRSAARSMFGYPAAHDDCLLIRPADGRRSSPTARNARTSPALSCRSSRTGVIHCPCHDGVFDLATGRPHRRPAARARCPHRPRGAAATTIYATGIERRTV